MRPTLSDRRLGKKNSVPAGHTRSMYAVCPPVVRSSKQRECPHGLNPPQFADDVFVNEKSHVESADLSYPAHRPRRDHRSGRPDQSAALTDAQLSRMVVG